MFSTLWQAASTLLGGAVFVGLMWRLAKTHSFQWRIASEAYAGRATTSPTAKKFPESVVIAQRGATGPLSSGAAGFRVYAGVSMAIHDDGLALSLVPPFNVMCHPLRLPYDEMQVVPTSWALWPEPVAIRMKRVPNVEIILARGTVRWLRDRSEHGPFGRQSSMP